MPAMLPFALFFAASAAGGTDPVVRPPNHLLRGVAQDAKGRALLEADNGEVWTVLAFDAWPDGISGQRVRVVGVPRRSMTSTVPVATQGPDGSWSQGVSAGSGSEQTLRGAKWTRLPPAAGAWTVEVRRGAERWMVSGAGPTASGGATEVGVRRLFAAIGAAQGATAAWAGERGPGVLEVRTGGVAGEGGALLRPGPEADTVEAAIAGVADPK